MSPRLARWPAAFAAATLFVCGKDASAQTPTVRIDPVRGVTLSDGDAALNVRGYLVYEAADIDGGAPRLKSDADVRFADVIATAKALDGHVSGAFVYDFRNQTRPIEDAWLAGAAKGFAVVIGNHKEPFSLQALNGSPDRTLAEAAIPQALAPDRALGVSLGAVGRRVSITAGAFDGNINDRVTTGWSLGARATYAPVLNGITVVHLGVAVNRRDPEAGPLAFSAFPATVRTNRPLIATGAIDDIDDIDAEWRYGAELAVRNGSLLVQSEYVRVTLDRFGREAVLKGGYVTASWAITGERRPYRVTSNPNERGAFGAISPAHPLGSGGLGAVELVARVSVTDLDRRDFPQSGQLTGTALGVNWVPHALIRLTLEGVKAWTDEARPERVSLLLARTYVFF